MSLTVGVKESPGAILGDGDHACGVAVYAAAVDASLVPRQVKGTLHALKVARLAKLHLPHLDVWCEPCGGGQHSILFYNTGYNSR